MKPERLIADIRGELLHVTHTLNDTTHWKADDAKTILALREAARVSSHQASRLAELAIKLEEQLRYG